MPQAICELALLGINRGLIVNRDRPPFDSPDLRRAMAMSLDRKAFIDIISERQGDIGGVMKPAPEGLWGMPPEMQRELPGYDPDAQKNRAEARQIMQKLGYGADNRLAVKVSARDLPFLRDPAVQLIDQLKEVYIDGTPETIGATNWFPKVIRRDTRWHSVQPEGAPTRTRTSTRLMGAVVSLTAAISAARRSTS